MFLKKSVVLCAVTLLSITASFATLWSYSGSGAWTPSSSYFSTQYENHLSYQITVPMEAVASESPEQITLKIYSAPDSATSFSDYSIYNTDLSGTYDVYRKDPEATSWGATIGSVTIGSTITTWVDTNVTAGVMYEYGLKPTSLPNDTSSYWLASFVCGNVLAGINVDCTDAKGHFAVVVAEDVLTNLPDEYAQYKEDLVKDGWTVHEIITPRAADYTSNGTGPADANGIPTGPYPTNHVHIRSQLQDLYSTYSNELKNVALIGKVQVARSGTGNVYPDGHGNRSACGVDAYYADMDGVWTDTGSNVAYYQAVDEMSAAISYGKINVPGDNKFDADYLSQITGPNDRLELGFGRIDMSHTVAAEYEALKNYFNKLHRYKTASADFRPGRRAIHRPGFGALSHEFMSSMPPVVGMTNMDFIVAADLPSVSGDQDADAAYTAQNSPYLFYLKGNGSPDYSHGSRAVFWTGMQSHWGWWFEPQVTSGQNRMVRRLSEDNYTLSYTWDISLNGFRTDYLYHRLGMGGTAGDMMRFSLSERMDSYSEGGGVYSRGDSALYMQHMGDPALRIFMFPPPTDLQVLPGSGNPQLSWTAAVAPAGEPQVLGYHVYRAGNANGPFARLTSSLVAGTSYADTSVSSGEWFYQVKAVRLEPCGGGTYYNSSLAAQQGIDLSGADPLAIDTNTPLPEANWDTDYEVQLTASGGTPLFSWTAIDSLPDGLNLSADGIISGKPSTNGTFVFTVQVTDALSQIAQAQFDLFIDDVDKQIVDVEAASFIMARDTDNVLNSYEPVLQVADGYDSFFRFDLSGIHTNDLFVEARLRVFIDETTPSGSPVVIKASLVEDGGDGWSEATLCYDNQPTNSPAVSTVTSTDSVVPGEFFEIDVTAAVLETLNSDLAKKLTIRLHSDTSVGWSEWVRIPNSYATAAARPQLIVQTTGAEGYVPPPPSALFSTDKVSGDIPLVVTFYDQSVGSITNRFWDFGDGSTTNTTGGSFQHIYTTGGTYTVTLIASGDGPASTNTKVALITATDPWADGISVIGDAADQTIGLNASLTPTLASIAQGTLSAGDDNFTWNQGECCGIMVFELPDIGDAEVSSANLSVMFEADYIKGGDDSVIPKWVDLYGVRTASANTVLTNDYGYKLVGTNNGTLVQSQFIVQETSEAMDPVPAETSPDGNVALGAWIQAQYDAGAQPGDFIFLRAHAVFASGNPFKISSGDSATPPELTIGLAAPGGGGTPPPPTAALGGSGTFGTGADVLNWTTVQGSGFVYSVWYSTNLMDGFQPLETNLPDTVQSITNLISAPSVFYKIEAQ